MSTVPRRLVAAPDKTVVTDAALHDGIAFHFAEGNQEVRRYMLGSRFMVFSGSMHSKWVLLDISPRSVHESRGCGGAEYQRESAVNGTSSRRQHETGTERVKYLY